MTREEAIDKILDELLDDFIKANLPLMKGITLFAKVQNAVYHIEALSAEPCEDYISREAVLNEWDKCFNKEDGYLCYQGFQDKIKSLSPVQPIRPKGKWEKYGDTLKCPICRAIGENIKDYYCFNFCPNCGADMRREEE